VIRSAEFTLKDARQVDGEDRDVVIVEVITSDY